MQDSRWECFDKGNFGEKLTKSLFSALGYKIIPATIEQQTQESWDFRACGLKNWTVEVKTDYKAEKTGNIFLETVVDGGKGFMAKYKSNSHIIFAFVLPVRGEIILVPVKKLLQIELKDYKHVEFKHKTNNYYAEGHLYPLEMLRNIAKRIFLFDKERNLYYAVENSNTIIKKLNECTRRSRCQ